MEGQSLIVNCGSFNAVIHGDYICYMDSEGRQIDTTPITRNSDLENKWNSLFLNIDWKVKTSSITNRLSFTLDYRSSKMISDILTLIANHYGISLK